MNSSSETRVPTASTRRMRVPGAACSSAPRTAFTACCCRPRRPARAGGPAPCRARRTAAADIAEVEPATVARSLAKSAGSRRPDLHGDAAARSRCPSQPGIEGADSEAVDSTAEIDQARSARRCMKGICVLVRHQPEQRPAAGRTGLAVLQHRQLLRPVRLYHQETISRTSVGRRPHLHDGADGDRDREALHRSAAEADRGRPWRSGSSGWRP